MAVRQFNFYLLNSQDVPADFRHVQKPQPSWQDDQVIQKLIKRAAVKKTTECH